MKKVWKFCRTALQNFNTNTYTVLFFTLMIVLVYMNNLSDGRKTTVRQQIVDDLKGCNGTPELYDEVNTLLRGEAVSIRSSLFSFKELLYSFKYPTEYHEGVWGGGICESEVDESNYYFLYNQKLVQVNARHPEEMQVKDIRNDLGESHVIYDPGGKINWVQEYRLQSLLDTHRVVVNSTREIAHGSKLNKWFVRIDSVLLQGLSRGARVIGFAGFDMFLSDNNGGLFRTELIPSPDWPALPTSYYSFSGELDEIVSVNLVDTVFVIGGRKQGIWKEVLIPYYDAAIKPITSLIKFCEVNQMLQISVDKDSIVHVSNARGRYGNGVIDYLFNFEDPDIKKSGVSARDFLTIKP